MKEDIIRTINQFRHSEKLDLIKEELLLVNSSEISEHKDIILVVKDQLKLLQNCINSIYDNTENFTLYIWDNASRPDTKKYLESLLTKGNVILRTSQENIGFMPPNNRMAELTKAPYIILLNIDTEVRKNWDKLMIAWLKTHPKTLQVGYGGCCLNEDFKGGLVGFGDEIDYLSGWGFCISRETYNQFGIFDEANLQFGYCEDADLSLRIREAGFEIYALHADLITHYENSVFKEVNKDDKFRQWFAQIFEKNHEYMRNKWKGKGMTILERKSFAE